MGKHSIRPYFAALLAAFMLILVLPAQATAATQIQRVDECTDTFCITSFFTSNVIVNDNNTTILFHSRFTLDVFAPCVSTASGREQFAVHLDNTAPITQVSRDHSFQQIIYAECQGSPAQICTITFHFQLVMGEILFLRTEGSCVPL